MLLKLHDALLLFGKIPIFNQPPCSFYMCIFSIFNRLLLLIITLCQCLLYSFILILYVCAYDIRRHTSTCFTASHGYALRVTHCSRESFYVTLYRCESDGQKFFTDVLFHSAYNKLMLFPSENGKARQNHGRAVIHRCSPNAMSSAFYNYTHDDLALSLLFPYRVAIDTSTRHPLSSRIEEN